jgi:hypothetical protein
MFISYCEDFVGIKPHWALFYHCFDVLPQSDRKVIGSIDLPSNAPNWAKKWFYVYDYLAPAFSHQLPPPLPVAKKEEVLES